MPLPLLRLLLIASLAAEGAAAMAVDSGGSEPIQPRPRVGLVLSGGGARGFAHIGVLRALQRLRVPVDIVVGTSMGAVVGGAFAAGGSVDDLEGFVAAADWPALLADRPAREQLSVRRREDDRLMPSRIEFGITRRGVELPPGAAGNQALESALQRLLPPGMATQPASRLPLAYRAVATDLRSGELVELRDAPLHASVRASLSVPGLLAPVAVDGRLLVDGGLVRNLPLDIARAMGAEILIAVNVGTSVGDGGNLGSALGVAQQMLNILTEQNVERSLRELSPQDVLIAPELGRLGFADFRGAAQAVAAGERAAMAIAARLQTLAVAEAPYAAWEAHRAAALPPASDGEMRRLARLEVRGTGFSGAAALAAESGLAVGEPVTASQARRAADRLYGRGDFERVEVDIDDDADGRRIVLRPVEAEWRRSRVRLGLELSSDFADDNNFSVGAMHTLSWIDDWGAELRTRGRLGSARSLESEFWQPLGPGSPWFAALSAHYSAGSRNVYSDGLRVLRSGLKEYGTTLALGRQLGSLGDLRLGVIRVHDSSEQEIPQPAVPVRQRAFETVQFVQVRLDTLEPLAFPTQGFLVDARYENRPAADPGLPRTDGSQLSALVAFRLGAWGGHAYAEGSTSTPGLVDRSLGGFLRLSGTTRNSLNGNTVLFGRAVLGRAIGQMPAGLGGAIRGGVSLETGGAFVRFRDADAGSLRQAGSAFISVDTRFGPLYLAAGATARGQNAFYLFLGPYW